MEKAARAVLQALLPDEGRAFATGVGARVGVEAPFAQALVVELEAAPRQTALRAVARASQRAGISRTVLKEKLKIPVGRELWKGARARPTAFQKPAGGARGTVGNPVLAGHVRKFLERHSTETSRFCRTKQRDRKVDVYTGAG